jgi:hypothetical protein
LSCRAGSDSDSVSDRSAQPHAGIVRRCGADPAELVEDGGEEVEEPAQAVDVLEDAADVEDELVDAVGKALAEECASTLLEPKNPPSVSSAPIVALSCFQTSSRLGPNSSFHPIEV